jgi:hypothetical protein
MCRTDRIGMKILHNVGRFLLGLMFLFFGLKGFFHFVAMPPSSDVVDLLIGTSFLSKYFLVICALEAVSGALLLVNRYVPLALTILGTIIANILLLQILANPAGLGLALLVTLLWAVVFTSVRSAFATIFESRFETKLAPVVRHRPERRLRVVFAPPSLSAVATPNH